ncbi:MAG: hypothetical protein AB7U46_00315 [Paenirhodobacter sp.]|uniref:hypothetical protein n=1 Tax=Paenirhodobacter sp. TaxID=1965326 RepID=UPI003D104A4D
MIDVRDITCDPPLHLSFSPGRSKRLVISLAGVGTNRRQVPPVEFARIAHWNGENNVLYVSDESRSWMNGPGIADFVVEAAKATAQEIGAEEICAIGNSMGGTAALILAALMPIDHVVAIAPQFSVKPGVVPEEDRWMYFRKRITDWPFPEVPDLRDTDSEVTILHGGSDDELAHARRFPDDAGYWHYIFPRHGHTLARGLHEAGLLAPIVTMSILGRTLRARRAVRAADGISRRKYDRMHTIPLSEEAL